MLPVNEPRPHGNSRGKHPLNRQVVHPHSSSYHIYDGVKGADFVKVNLIDLFAVNFSLGGGQSMEYIQAPVFHRLIQWALFDHPFDFAIGTLRAVTLPDPHLHMGPIDPHPFIPFYFYVEWFNPQLCHLFEEDGFRQTDIDQSPQDHVPTDARKAIEIAHPHSEPPFP